MNIMKENSIEFLVLPKSYLTFLLKVKQANYQDQMTKQNF